jgi:hypothetical protein
VTDQPPQPASFQFHVPDELQSGVYANVLSVWHTVYEFTLDFAVTQPASQVETPEGHTTVVPSRVVARIKVPPSLVFSILRTINENMGRYEEAFGPIPRPDEGEGLLPPDDAGAGGPG